MTYQMPTSYGILTPSRMTSRDGTVYAMPYWIALENEAHWNAINDVYNKNKPKPPERNKEVNKHKVLNYLVVENNGSWSCTCKGYQFRRICRHIKHIRDGEQLEKK